MDEKLIEIREYRGTGYRPLVDYGAWRVAVLNYIDEIHPANNSQMERHNETDEVFVLLRGRAILFAGEGEHEVEAIHPQVMDVGKVYNVKRSIWHTIVMSPDASVLITENSDTSRANSDYSPLTETQRRFLQETAHTTYPDLW